MFKIGDKIRYKAHISKSSDIGEVIESLAGGSVLRIKFENNSFAKLVVPTWITFADNKKPFRKNGKPHPLTRIFR